MDQEQLKNKMHTILVEKVKTKKVITQKALAERCHVSEMAVSKWLRKNNPSYPSIYVICDLCDALEVSILEFCGFTKDELSEALKLKEAYDKHPDRKDSVDILLELK